MLRGHRCPLLRLHDQGLCVHQAKPIEMANWKDRPIRSRPRPTPGMGRPPNPAPSGPPRATPIHGPGWTGHLCHSRDGRARAVPRELQAVGPAPLRTAPQSQLSPLLEEHAPWVRAAGGDKAHPRAGRRPGTAHCELQVAVLTLNRQLSVCAPRILKQRKRTEAPRVRLSCPPNPGCEHVHLGAPGLSLAEAGQLQSLI